MKNTSGLKRGGPGRPKGAVNKATREFKAWAEKFAKEPDYRLALERRLKAGKAPQFEVYLHQLLHGKPKEQIEHSGELKSVPAIVNVFTDGDTDFYAVENPST
jgi:hypothetical protein